MALNLRSKDYHGHNLVHVPRKRFGQHFLRDSAIIRRIIAALAPRAHEHLVEIGPGQGALTIPVLQEVKALDVIELDRDLIAMLEAYARQDDLQIHAADALEFDFAQLKTDDRLLRVFGNLPYNISTPLIFHLLSFAPIVSDMLFMLQKEVAERLVAQANTNNYGRLSVMVQYYCEVKLLFDVPASAFYPRPQVTSSIVQLLPFRHSPHPVNDDVLFATIVKLAFNQRRKTLRNSLKNCIADGAWAHMPISSHLRAENLSVKDYVTLANTLINFKNG